MSVEAMSWAFAVELPPCPKSVLVSLANRADEQGYCYPGLDDLERRTGWKRRAIQLAIKALVAQQLLLVAPRYQPSGRQTSNCYRLAIGSQPAPMGSGEGAPDAPSGVHQMHGEGAPDAPSGVHQMHGEGAPDAPHLNLHLNSSEEQSGEAGAGAPLVVPEVSSGDAWEAYATAYRTRYGVEPVRNAQTNALLARVVKKLGVKEAPSVIAFYVQSQRPLYVANCHPCSLLVRDAEGLRTEWATGRVSGPMTPPPQQKCAWVSGGACEAYAMPGSRYCLSHKAQLLKIQARLAEGNRSPPGAARPGAVGERPTLSELVKSMREGRDAGHRAGGADGDQSQDRGAVEIVRVG